MANKGVHKAYSRSFNLHSPQAGRRTTTQNNHNSSFHGHRRLEDSISSTGADTRRPQVQAQGQGYGDELTVTSDVSRPRSRSQTTPRTISKSASPQNRRSHQEVFSDQQKSLLRHSWDHVGKHGHSGIGAMIYRRIFERRPLVRQMFDFGSVPSSRLENNASFELHARNFVNVLEGAIRSLDTSFELDFGPELLAKGRFHAQFADRGFKTEYWDVFAEAMTESAVEWIGPGKHRETVRAWTLLVSCIIDRMRTGYEEEVRRRRKANSVSHLHLSDDRNSGSNRSVTPSPPAYSSSPVNGPSAHSSMWLRVEED